MFEICVNQSCKPVQQELKQVEYGPKFSTYYEHKNLGLAVNIHPPGVVCQ